FQAEDGIRDLTVTGVQTCALPIFAPQVQSGATQLLRIRTPGTPQVSDRMSAGLLRSPASVPDLSHRSLSMRERRKPDGHNGTRSTRSEWRSDLPGQSALHNLTCPEYHGQ